MKLLTQSGLYMVTLSLVLFFACGVAFYFVFKTLTNQSLDQELHFIMDKVNDNPESFIHAYEDSLAFFDQIEIIPDESVADDVIVYDSLILAGENASPIPVRFLEFKMVFNNENYRVRVYKSKISSDDLTVRITGLITLLALFFSIGILLLNRFGFRRTWSGFWKSLDKLKNFRAGDKPPVFETTEIDEFESLNRELAKLTERISNDYDKLESFTSHTTHEFQTPLAVIKGKVDLLLQSENLSEKQLNEIQQINRYAGQLSRLNQALSLLFKIENQQFVELESVSLKQLLNNHKDYITEQCELRNLKYQQNIESDLLLSMNRSLADILLLNLVRNALVHNVEGGKIDVTIEKNRFVVSNTGAEPGFDTEKIFNEFTKGRKSGGLGLGLAIAKKICIQYGISLNYNYNDHIHSVIVQV